VEAGGVADALQDLEAGATPAEGAFARELLARLRSGELSLPPMPRVVLRIGRLLSDPAIALADLAREIELDPAVATRLVGIANSPFYSGLESVRSVADAVTRLGMRETWRSLLAIALRSKVFRGAGAKGAAQQLWEHALAAAAAGQALAAEQAIDPDPAFLAGLVHDIGRLALLATSDEIVRRSRGQARPAPAQLELLLERAHAPLGAQIARSWGLDAEISRAVETHHAVAPEPGLARVLGAADALARRTAGAAPQPDDALRLESLGLESEDLAAAAAEASETYAQLVKWV
jgi:putative nucleotidyltransferase with HDIG domain